MNFLWISVRWENWILYLSQIFFVFFKSTSSMENPSLLNMPKVFCSCSLWLKYWFLWMRIFVSLELTSELSLCRRSCVNRTNCNSDPSINDRSTGMIIYMPAYTMHSVHNVHWQMHSKSISAEGSFFSILHLISEIGWTQLKSNRHTVPSAKIVFLFFRFFFGVLVIWAYKVSWFFASASSKILRIKQSSYFYKIQNCLDKRHLIYVSAINMRSFRHICLMHSLPSKV